MSLLVSTFVIRAEFGEGGDFPRAVGRMLATLSRQANRIYYDDVRQIFAKQGDPPQSWKKLAEMTLEERKTKGYRSGPILVRSGQFRSAVAGFPSAGIQGSVRGGWAPTQIRSNIEGHTAQTSLSNFHLTILRSTDDPRFSKLHSGGLSELGNYVPARPVLPRPGKLPGGDFNPLVELEIALYAIRATRPPTGRYTKVA